MPRRKYAALCSGGGAVEQAIEPETRISRKSVSGAIPLTDCTRGAKGRVAVAFNGTGLPYDDLLARS